jgi:glycosyltransferase involved in cell wall biosynthesis
VFLYTQMEKLKMVSNYPKITIVTPNYNLGEYLEQTILSVINQGYPNLEYIIIDGGSTDNSVEIIKKYEKSLTYWVSEADKGLYDALNKGFKRSTGEIMGWINSDDMLHPRSLFYVAGVFNQFDDVEWIQGRPSFFDKKGGIFNIGIIKPWSKYDFYAGHYEWIQQESTFWRRTLWNKVGGRLNSDLKFAGDFDLWLRFFGCAKLHSLSVVLSGFRLRGKEQLSSNYIEVYHKEAKATLIKTVQEFGITVRLKIALVKLLFVILMVVKKIKIFNTHAFEMKVIPKLLRSGKIITWNYEKQFFVK